MKLSEKNKENLLSGNYSSLFLSILLTYSGFSFFPSEIASALESDSTSWSNAIFKLFFLLYPVLPVLGLVVIVTFKTKRVGSYSYWFPAGRFYGGTLLTEYWPYWWPWKTIINFLVLGLIGVFIGLIPTSIVESRQSLDLYSQYQDSSSHIQSQIALLERLKKDNLPLNAQHLVNGFYNQEKKVERTSLLIKSEFSSNEYIDELISLYEKSDQYDRSELIIELISLKLKYDIENLKYTLESEVKDQFSEILSRYRPYCLITVAVIFIGLILFLLVGDSQEGRNNNSFWVQSIVGCYVLMFVQLAQPIDTDKINLRYPDFKYTQRNWYLPSFVKSTVSQITTYDQREYDITMEDSFDDFNEILSGLTLEIRNRNQKIDSLTRAIEDYMKNVDPIEKDDLRSLKEIVEKLNKLY